MKLGGEIKTRRLSVRDEHEFVNVRARSSAREARAKKPSIFHQTGWWRRPIDSRTPVRSPATLAGLTVYLAAARGDVLLRHAAFRCAVLE